jgi:hypothetical protein
LTFKKLIPLLSVLLFPAAAHALDRNAFTFTRYDLSVTVTPEKSELVASGRISARNDSSAPQRNLVLQISSSLAWTSITIGGKQVTIVRQPYHSDIDHSGELNEAILNLPGDVAPGQSVTVDVAYEGQIAQESTRLTRIGVPEALAQHNDWDQISTKFTAVRGLGYVLWYPVAMDAASLTDGREFFDALADWKRRHAGSTMSVKMQVPPGHSVAATAPEIDPVTGPLPAFKLTWPPPSPPSASPSTTSSLSRPRRSRWSSGTRARTRRSRANSRRPHPAPPRFCRTGSARSAIPCALPS